MHATMPIIMRLGLYTRGWEQLNEERAKALQGKPIPLVFPSSQTQSTPKESPDIQSPNPPS